MGTITRLEAIGLAVLFSDDVPWKPVAQANTLVHPVPVSKLSVVTCSTATAFAGPTWTVRAVAGLEPPGGRESSTRVGLAIAEPGSVPLTSTTRSVACWARTHTSPLASVGTITRLEAIGLALLFRLDVPWKPAAQANTAVQPVPVS